MSATVHILAPRAAVPCRRCGGTRRLTYDELNAAEKNSAPSGAIFPCPECGDDAEVIPFEPEARTRAATDHFERAMAEPCDVFGEGA